MLDRNDIFCSVQHEQRRVECPYLLLQKQESTITEILKPRLLWRMPQKKRVRIVLPYYTLSALQLYMEVNKEDTIDLAANTDSERLIDIMVKNPFVPAQIIHREEELAGDRVPKPLVIASTLEKMEQLNKTHYDMVVDMDLTSPLRKVEDIVHLVETQKKCKADVTYSVTDSRRNPYFNMVMKGDKGYRKVLASNFAARQQAPVIYDMNASLYAYDPAFLRTGKGVLDGYGEIIIMEDTGVLDLDHANDFELMQVIARYLYENRPAFREIYQQIQNVVL